MKLLPRTTSCSAWSSSCLAGRRRLLTYGIFSKKFVDYDEVTLQTSTIGLQLPARADVKIRGVIVGEVLGFDTIADGAELTLGLYPEPDRHDPGERDRLDRAQDAVRREVRLPGGPRTSRRRRATSSPATTIKRTDVSIEVEKVLSDLYPLLRTVQPAEINKTLNALSTALEGRGEQIGENLETVDSYLKRLNPQIPGLVEDLRLTAAGLRHLLPGAARRSRQILRNTVKTTGHARGPRGQAERAVHRRRGVLRHRHGLPRRERRQPDPAQPGQRPAAARCSRSTPRSSPA